MTARPTSASPAPAGGDWPPACPRCGQDHRDEDGEIVECRPAPAGEATVSEAEVEAAYAAWKEAVLNGGGNKGCLRRALEAFLRARAAAQGAGAQPVAWENIDRRGRKYIGRLPWPRSAANDGYTSRPLGYIDTAPPDAPRPDIEAARREERERCAKVAEDLRHPDWSRESVDWVDGTEAVAAAIRALGDRP